MRGCAASTRCISGALGLFTVARTTWTPALTLTPPFFATAFDDVIVSPLIRCVRSHRVFAHQDSPPVNFCAAYIGHAILEGSFTAVYAAKTTSGLYAANTTSAMSTLHSSRFLR